MKNFPETLIRHVTDDPNLYAYEQTPLALEKLRSINGRGVRYVQIFWRMASVKKHLQPLKSVQIVKPQRKSGISHCDIDFIKNGKMALVDINSINRPATVKKQQDDPILQALNALVASNEFSRDEYGSKAKYLADLDTKMKEILESNYMDPAEKVKHYNRELQKYLFHVAKKYSDVATKEEAEEEDDYGRKNISRDFYESSTSAVIEPSTSSIFDETQRAHKTPFHFAGRAPHKNNLPRETPKAERLRTNAERRKNSRLSGYFDNWEEYA